jgi:hypothetical protein
MNAVRLAWRPIPSAQMRRSLLSIPIAVVSYAVTKTILAIAAFLLASS